MNFRDYLIFSAGIITGGLIIGIRDIYVYNAKARKSLKKVLRGPDIYTPPRGKDIKKGIHFRGKMKGMSRRVWPPPAHGGGHPGLGEELDSQASQMIKLGKSFNEVYLEIYRPTINREILQDNIDERNVRGKIRRRVKRKYPDLTL
jgi:hypothetical protein